MTNMTNFDWQCPFCSRYSTITKESICSDTTDFFLKNAEGPRILNSVFIVCPNPSCKKFSLRLTLFEMKQVRKDLPPARGQILNQWQLIPASKAQSFPSYIPQTILADYNEACLIAKLSPKASATLSRRCLQGVLRDFWNVKPGRLVDEIDQIKGKVDPLTWSAIEAVRKLGNIGAHMEKDINVIVDVDPDEADHLIELIETVLKNWYITREEHKSRLEKIIQISQKKEVSKKGGNSVP